MHPGLWVSNRSPRINCVGPVPIDWQFHGRLTSFKSITDPAAVEALAAWKAIQLCNSQGGSMFYLRGGGKGAQQFY
jgi:hypothetical protein